MNKYKILNLYAGIAGYRDVLRNLVDYEAGKTILDTAMNIVRQSDTKQIQMF
jgi:hypothetical protein